MPLQAIKCNPTKFDRHNSKKVLEKEPVMGAVQYTVYMLVDDSLDYSYRLRQLVFTLLEGGKSDGRSKPRNTMAGD